MILLVEKQAMSLVGSNSNLYVPLLGIYLALKTSGLGALPPGGGGRRRREREGEELRGAVRECLCVRRQWRVERGREGGMG